MPVFMDDIAAVAKYMVINTGEESEIMEERVKEGIVQETDIYKYLGMVINKLGNLNIY